MQKTLLISLTIIFHLHLAAQSRILTGKITDVDNGDPLIGVNVLLQDTQNGTQTDANGNIP